MIRFVRSHKTLVLSLAFLVLFSVTVSYATPPSSPYAAGATLDPSCAPGSTNCTVTVGTALTFGTGLTQSGNTVTNNLSTGVAGGQNIIGGTGTTDTLSLVGTTGNGNAASSAINFKTGNNGGTTAMVITNAGNVGIGFATPNATLVVAGNRSSTSWGVNGVGLQLRAATYTDTTSTATVGDIAVNSIAIPIVAANNAVNYTNASTLYIGGAPSAGTNATIANPWALNVVTGNANFGGIKAVFGNTVEKVNVGSASGTTSVSFNRDIQNGAIYDSNGYAYQFMHTRSNVDSSDRLALGVYDPTGASIFPGALTVTGQGFVGVGTISPTQMLSVAGNIKISGNGNGLYFPDGSFISTNTGGAGVGMTSVTDLSFSADSDNNGSGVINFSAHGIGAMTIANNGFVGINTTNPTQALTINGNIQIVGTGNGLYFADGSFMGSAANIGTGISAPGDISLVADTDQDGVGTIGLSTGSVQRFLVTNAGRIGIGTAAPTTTMQIVSTAGNGVQIGGSTYPAALGTNGLNVDGSIRTGGAIVIGGNNSALSWGSSFASIRGSSPAGGPTFLSFYTGSGPSERMRIIDNGNIGIGTITPNALLGVGSTAISSGTIVAEFQNAGGTCDLDPSATGGLSCSSDMTLKKNIVTLDTGAAWNFNSNIAVENQSVLNKILALTPVSYNWNVESDTAAKHAGFIAQEVRQVFPDLVQTNPNTNTLSLNYAGLIPYTVAAIKEMNVNITTIANLDRPNSWREALVSWLGSATNGITDIFSKKVTTDELTAQKICIGSADSQVCITKDQLQQLLQNNNGSIIVSTPSVPVDTITAPDSNTQTPGVAPVEPVVDPVSEPTDSTPE